MTNTPTTFFGWIIFLIQQYHGYYLQGLLTTLETSLAGTICGCFLGFLVGIIQATDIRAQDNMIKKILLGIPWVIAKIYVTIFRGTPMIVQAMVIYYGSSTVFGTYPIPSAFAPSICPTSMELIPPRTVSDI